MQRGGTQHLWAAMRSIVSARDGYRCFYCKVPTAATIEHTEALSASGAGAKPSQIEKLRIACPWCNSVKGSEAMASFLAREGWRMDVPEGLPLPAREMVRLCFGLVAEGDTVATGSTNSRLRFRKGIAIAEVRAHKRDKWQLIPLGPEEHPRVVAACWLFLRRHNTRLKKPLKKSAVSPPLSAPTDF